MITIAVAGLIIAGIAVVSIMWGISRYNRLVTLKSFSQEGWSGIDVQLKRRYDLIPNLVGVVEGYKIHEREVLENVTKMRAASMGATTIDAKAHAEAGLTGALKTLFAVAENYPNLKANESFLALQQQLSSLESEIQLARRYYNGAARNYNVAVHSFPSNVIASMFGFAAISYFELNSAQEREVPRVKF
ncbi:MAG: LemA family protein [uncultured bacterium]|nr:MAG: LemA family protein [uncultured bacterium]